METPQVRSVDSRRPRRVLFALIGSLALAALACSVLSRIPSPDLLPTVEGLPSIPGVGATQWEAVPEGAQSLPDLVERGVAEVDSIVAVEETPSGPNLRVTVRNPGPDVLVVTIPCGTILVPTNGDVQQMMVVQPASESIPPGETVEITLFVVCIDATSDTPSAGDGFAFGPLAEGDVLKLAECACRDGQIAGANPLPLIGLQFTTWMVREGISEEDLLAEGEGAAGEFLGEDQALQLGQMLEGLSSTTGDWLERCGVETAP
jgi:hypothetical protein